MSNEKDSKAQLDDMLRRAAVVNQNLDDNSNSSLSPEVRALMGDTVTPFAVTSPPSNEQPQDFAIAKDTAVAPAAPAPAALPSAPAADLEQPTAPASDELATTAGKRPLAHFGQALPVTKSKANRKLVLQLTPEMHQYFAHVSTLPGLDGVPLSDLAVVILQAWREDYRPEIKRANAAFKA